MLLKIKFLSGVYFLDFKEILERIDNVEFWFFVFIKVEGFYVI